MKREIGWDAVTCDPASVVTVGTFDGVHRGHQAILQYLIQRAAERKGPSTLISFDPHPRSVVHGDPVPLLTTVEERAELLDEAGLDRFVVLPFTDNFARLDATTYVEEVLVRRVGLQEIAVGYDHRFGANREGDVDLLRTMGTEHGFTVDVIPAQEVGHQVVSSSAVRECLTRGAVDEAASLLGRPYAIRGTVAHGEGRGRQIGFPTANLEFPDPRKLTPQNGVYATRTHLPGGEVYAGMMNIGRRPTFDGMNVTVEVHLLAFEGDLYGKTLRVEFLQRLRDEQRFSSPDDLAVQLAKDKRHCRDVVETVE
jgi:riboflavin kinase/FMN adenylyltransferase